MTEFNEGDKVRLKARPEVECYIDREPSHDDVEFRLKGLPDEFGLATYRLAEELELVPEPPSLEQVVALVDKSTEMVFSSPFYFLNEEARAIWDAAAEAGR